MGDKTSIEWTDATWNPVTGCTRVSEGCRNCYMARTVPRQGQDPWTVVLHPDRLEQPLRWKKPRRIFVNSLSDLFHEDVPGEFLDQVFAIMALARDHTFQCLSKRPERMRAYLSNPDTPGRVARAVDIVEVAREIAAMGEPKIEPVPGYPGYLVSDHGDVFSQEGSPTCIRCGNPMPDGIARRLYCGKKCRQLDAYYKNTGRQTERQEGAFRPMKLMPGEDGHQRVMLYCDGKATRELVHRLVLTVFDRPPREGEQGCHRNGDPTNNALPNIRWGSQSHNWNDRKRHGIYRSYSKLTHEQVAEIRRRAGLKNSAASIGRHFGVSDTQIRNIIRGDQWATEPGVEWPLPNFWAGVSVENQATADARIPLLLQTPASVRFVSAEPLLDITDIRAYLARAVPFDPYHGNRIDWVIVGGESGPGARPMHPTWARSLRDQCVVAGVPYFFKQHGEYRERTEQDPKRLMDPWVGDRFMTKVGKKAAGRVLDGRTWNEFPP